MVADPRVRVALDLFTAERGERRPALDERRLLRDELTDRDLACLPVERQRRLIGVVQIPRHRWQDGLMSIGERKAGHRSVPLSLSETP